MPDTDSVSWHTDFGPGEDLLPALSEWFLPLMPHLHLEPSPYMDNVFCLGRQPCDGYI